MSKAFGIAIVLALIELRAVDQASAITYLLKGSLTYQVHTVDALGNPQERPALNREFEVLVKDCTWNMRTRLAGNKDFDNFHYSFDGTNLYYTYTLAKGARPDAPAPTKARKEEELLQPVIVEAGPVPRTITSAAGEYVWLAFASGCYFRSLSSNTVIDFHVIESRLGSAITTSRRLVECRYLLSSAPPYLPREVDYLLPADDSSGTEGALRARFRSGGFTNFDGVYVPTQFQYDRYVPATLGSGSKPRSSRIALTVRGLMSSMSTGEIEWEGNIPIKKVMVSDLRVPEPAVIYPISNGILPSLADNGLLALRKQASERATNEKKGFIVSHASGKRKVILAIMAIFALSVIIYAFVRTTRKPV